VDNRRDAVAEEMAIRRIPGDLIRKYTDLRELPQRGARLAASAVEHGAPPDVLQRLRELDPDHEFVNADALWATLGYSRTQRR
jgi:hypothetical protein